MHSNNTDTLPAAALQATSGALASSTAKPQETTNSTSSDNSKTTDSNIKEDKQPKMSNAPEQTDKTSQEGTTRLPLLKRFSRFMRAISTGLFKPNTWAFWRATIVCFCIGCIVGHWLEIPYCSIMNLFGIVEADYAVWTDPWYHPYWVYGIGSVGLILCIEPLKEFILKQCKTLWGAFFVMWGIAILLSMAMELGFGLLINQPDATGEYPYWDNSQLPLNIFGQAWLVNDIFIGLAGTLCVWFIFPLTCAMFKSLEKHFDKNTANKVFGCIVVGFALCCFASYMELALWTKY